MANRRKKKTTPATGKSRIDSLVPASLFLVGLTLLFDALGAAFVFSQLPQNIFGSSATLIWTYIVVRFVAGITALVVGAIKLGK